jgi:hypothetical protein
MVVESQTNLQFITTLYPAKRNPNVPPMQYNMPQYSGINPKTK